MNLESLKFTKTHEWLNDSELNSMVLGITQHAQELLGDIVFVELPTIGRQVSANEAIGVLESVKAAADFYSPIAGTIVAINEEIKTKPELINQEPYDSGWLVKIAAKDADATTQLLSVDEYNKSITEA